MRCTSSIPPASWTCSRRAPTASGPIVIGGTKWPSITSTWITRAPASITARTWSPSRAKSADRIDGATRRSRSSSPALTALTLPLPERDPPRAGHGVPARPAVHAVAAAAERHHRVVPGAREDRVAAVAAADHVVARAALERVRAVVGRRLRGAHDRVAVARADHVLDRRQHLVALVR